MLTPIKILLADADTADATEVRWALDKLKVNYSLTHVTSGGEVIRCLQKDDAEGKLPYVLLMDINLPDKNGVEVLTEIRQNAAWKKIKCFFLSRGGKRPDAKQLRHLNIAGYISKPFQLSNSLSMDSLNLVIDLVNFKTL
ncbi:response regulator [Sediminibacterium roseum]|uniref:Response regulator n=1 Tax=Sediminibacterium roseum TaxID=1978412 RepID=A0ABW9ZUJ3_9BACT|nr:response regulator [Sediminibacterium roseum]NCI50822.1 response regulator [Sediminibacterium roseum]